MSRGAPISRYAEARLLGIVDAEAGLEPHGPRRFGRGRRALAEHRSYMLGYCSVSTPPPPRTYGVGSSLSPAFVGAW